MTDQETYTSGRSEQAVALVRQVVNEILGGSPNLISCARRFQYACQLSGSESNLEWASRELRGYPADATPSYRHCNAVRSWSVQSMRLNLFNDGPELPPSKSVPANLFVALEQLVSQQAVGFAEGEPFHDTLIIKGRSQTIVQTGRITPQAVAHCISLITQELFERATTLLIALDFTDTIESIFDKYRSRVEGKMAELGIAEELEVMKENLTPATEASSRAALMAARNVVHTLANNLWQVPGNEYPHIPNREGTGNMIVSADRPRNRLRAYLHQHGIKTGTVIQTQLELLMGTIDALYSAQSAGKSEAKPPDAEYVALMTYSFVGELVRLTPATPVMTLTDPSAS